MFFEVRGHIFFTRDNFQGTFDDFRFMIFSKVLMKELTLILIHVHKKKLLRRNFNIALIK